MSKEILFKCAKTTGYLILNFMLVWLFLAISIWGFRQSWAMDSPITGSFHILCALIGASIALIATIFGSVAAFCLGFEQ